MNGVIRLQKNFPRGSGIRLIPDPKLAFRVQFLMEVNRTQKKKKSEKKYKTAACRIASAK